MLEEKVTSKIPKKIKFGIKFKDGYKIEAEAQSGNQLCPVSVYHETDEHYSSYYIWDGEVHNYIYGQLMTLVEAIIENPTRQKAVKSLVKKELSKLEDMLEERAKYSCLTEPLQ